MQLSRHLDKGFWAFALQGLVGIYGVVFMFLVVRALPPDEFGNFVLIQTAFLAIAQLGNGFAFGPMVKYYYDYEDRRILATNSLYLGVGFAMISGLLIWLFRVPLGSLFNSAAFAGLAYYIPILLMVSVGKFFSNQVMRSVYRIRGIFWTHVVYHGVATLLIISLAVLHKLHSAAQMLWIITISFVLQSLMGFWMVRDHLKIGTRIDVSVLRKLFDFGKYNIGTVANSQVFDRLDVFMIAAIVGPVEVAIYQSARLFVRLIEMYRQIVGLLAMPAFAKLSSEKREKDIKAVYEKGILFSHVLLVPVAVLLMVFAKQLFHFFYGGKYLDGVILLQLFAITAPVFIWQSVGEGLLNGLGFPQQSFGARTATTVAKVLLNLLLISLWKSVGAVIATIISVIILAIIITFNVKAKINFTINGILSRFKDLKNFIHLARLQLKGVL